MSDIEQETEEIKGFIEDVKKMEVDQLNFEVLYDKVNNKYSSIQTQVNGLIHDFNLLDDDVAAQEAEFKKLGFVIPAPLDKYVTDLKKEQDILISIKELATLRAVMFKELVLKANSVVASFKGLNISKEIITQTTNLAEKMIKDTKDVTAQGQTLQSAYYDRALNTITAKMDQFNETSKQFVKILEMLAEKEVIAKGEAEKLEKLIQSVKTGTVKKEIICPKCLTQDKEAIFNDIESFKRHWKDEHSKPKPA